MSLITFELKEEHIKLLSNLKFRLKYGTMDFNIPFFEDGFDDIVNIYDEVDLILNGKSTIPDAPDLDELALRYSEKQVAEWKALLKELPTALDIILYTKKFEVGTYSTKYNIRTWKKIKDAIRI